MKTLEEQFKVDAKASPYSTLHKIVDYFEIEERGGGPEGIYYTHPQINGEFLLRNVHLLVAAIVMKHNLNILKQS